MTLSNTQDEWIEGDVYHLRSIKIGIYPDARIKFPFRNKLIKEILEWKPDIIHSQTEFSTMVAAKHIVGKLGISQIHTYHTMYEDYLDYIPGGETLKKSAIINLTRFLLNSFDGVIALTVKTEKALMGYGVSNNIYVIPTSINLDKFQKEFSLKERKELRLKLGIKEDDGVMVYVGRVAEEKSISEIIELLPDVRKDVENVKFLIVGGGPYLQKLREQVKKGELDGQIIFTAMVKPEEVYKYYKASEVFVTASMSETQGLTYLEALSSGCPVICKFSKYIAAILLNEDFRKNLSKEAAEGAHIYSSEAFADNVIKAYSKMLYEGRIQFAV
jgi:1,2-diacylglycerol 3-alpha-glucosyltransferase